MGGGGGGGVRMEDADPDPEGKVPNIRRKKGKSCKLALAKI